MLLNILILRTARIFGSISGKIRLFSCIFEFGASEAARR